MNPSTDQAWLGLEPGFTVFECGGKRIRFRCPYSLEQIVRIKEWDKGYLVVDAKHAHNDAPEEEYIDLVPVLQNLYIDPDSFLSPIKEVRLANAAPSLRR